MTNGEAQILSDLAVQLAALVSREEQRVSDRADDRELRAQLRASDNEWRQSTSARIDRVQTSVEGLSRNLAASMDTRVSDAKDLRQQSDDIVARMNAQAEEVAARLHAETEDVAAKLGGVTLQTAEILKGREDRKVVSRFFSRGVRIALAFIAVAMFTGLAFALFEHRNDISGDIATGIAAMAAAVAIVLALTRNK